MQDIDLLIEEIVGNLERFLLLIEAHLGRIAEEKATKFEELRPLLAGPETPPGVLIAAQLAALRRSYNHDQLGKVKYFLELAHKTAAKIDDLPYVWSSR